MRVTVESLVLKIVYFSERMINHVALGAIARVRGHEEVESGIFQLTLEVPANKKNELIVLVRQLYDKQTVCQSA